MIMNFWKILPSLFLFICFQNGNAQPLKDVPRWMMLEAAEESMAGHDYYNALDWYSQAYTEERDQNLALIIADLQAKLRDYQKAEKWYSRFVTWDRDNAFPMARYKYAQMLKRNEKNDEAAFQFATFYDLIENDSLKALAAMELQGLDLNWDFEMPIDIKIANPGKELNTAFSDFAPAFSPEDELYFTTFDRKSIIKLNGDEEDYHSKIFKTTRDKDKWAKPEPLSNKINREGFHSGNPGISKDGDRMYFTRAKLEGNDLVESKIFVSQRNGSEWGPAIEVESVNGDFISRHPSVGDLFGNEVLYFSSDMPGGKGGFDIYYATLQGGNSTDIPVNLGEVINTSGDEISPFYQEGELFFSSDGRPTLGGLDIFQTKWNGVVWGTPENMGLGYNSTADDFSYTRNIEGNLAAFVSNRKSEEGKSLKNKTCCDDIFIVTKKELIIDLLAVVNKVDGPLIGATIELVELAYGKESNHQSVTNNKGNAARFPLDPDKAYKVTASAKGYFSKSLEFDTEGLKEDQTIQKVLVLEAEPVKEEVVTYTINEPIRLNNIYYDFDDDKILPDAEKDLSVLLGLLDEYPDMVIELSSHTDAQGTDAYNDNLSQRRADSARRWLLERGVDPDRIVPTGYGERFILNRCVNGVTCDDNEHRFNRRTEFKIIAGPTSIEIKKSSLKKTTSATNDTSGSKQSYVPMHNQGKVELTFEKKSVDLGQVKRGEKRSFSYKFTNTGEENVRILLASACECTEVEWPTKVIKPGETGIIVADFDSTTKEKSETAEIDIILENTNPESDSPLFYILQYKFELQE